MNNTPLTPHEAAHLEHKRDDRRVKQPYASELDDRELEHAHKDGRPVNPEGEAMAREQPPKSPQAP